MADLWENYAYNGTTDYNATAEDYDAGFYTAFVSSVRRIITSVLSGRNVLPPSSSRSIISTAATRSITGD